MIRGCSELNAIICSMNSKHQKAFEALLQEPLNGNIDWARIEALLVALGCRVVEGPGSSVTFEHQVVERTFTARTPAMKPCATG